MPAGAVARALLTCLRAATCESLSARSACARSTAVKALLASSATSAMPAPSSSCACWISSYLRGQDTAVGQGPLVTRRMERTT